MVPVDSQDNRKELWNFVYDEISEAKSGEEINLKQFFDKFKDLDEIKSLSMSLEVENVLKILKVLGISEAQNLNSIIKSKSSSEMLTIDYSKVSNPYYIRQNISNPLKMNKKSDGKLKDLKRDKNIKSKLAKVTFNRQIKNEFHQNAMINSSTNNKFLDKDTHKSLKRVIDVGFVMRIHIQS